jgi:hypothetical protein
MKYTLEHLERHVDESVNQAFNNMSKLSQSILDIDGMSGDKTRHLYNNICSLDNANYLEIGTYKGSTFVSALYKNNATGLCIDYWKEFGGKQDFMHNVKEHLTNNETYSYIDDNCWNVTPEQIGLNKFDIYLYDANHSFEDHKRAITHYYRSMSKYFILLVDDWECFWVNVKRGTLAGIEESNLKIHKMIEVPIVTVYNYHTKGNTFWNGCGVFILERTDI